jgi:hypothetical protein
MKLHPPSLSGPQTPSKARDHAPEDALEKYRKDRLAFIAAIKDSPEALEGQGGALLVNLSQDPDPDVALSACRAIHHVLEFHGLILDGAETIETLCRYLSSFNRDNLEDERGCGARSGVISRAISWAKSA